MLLKKNVARSHIVERGLVGMSWVEREEERRGEERRGEEKRGGERRLRLSTESWRLEENIQLWVERDEARWVVRIIGLDTFIKKTHQRGEF